MDKNVLLLSIIPSSPNARIKFFQFGCSGNENNLVLILSIVNASISSFMAIRVPNTKKNKI